MCLRAYIIYVCLDYACLPCEKVLSCTLYLFFLASDGLVH